MALPREVIDEFPMFSYLLGDLHPHLLAMPFDLLAVAIALNMYLYLRNSGRRFNLVHWVKSPHFLAAALVLGGLSFLNTWDFPIYVALFAGAAALAVLLRSGWRLEAATDFLAIAVCLGVAGGLLYFPFYLTFASQANGLLPGLVFFTRGVHFWIMFGLLLLPMIAWMIWHWRQSKTWPEIKHGLVVSVAIIFGLWIFSILAGVLRIFSDPSIVSIWGAVDPQGLISTSLKDRFSSPGTWITLLVLLFLAWVILETCIGSRREGVANDAGPGNRENNLLLVSDPFILLVFLTGLGLAIFPEFFYLRDQFGTRMNTIFKFYFQAWILWSVAAGYASIVLIRNLRGVWRPLFRIGWVAIVLISLPYPFFGVWLRTNGFNPSNWSLDGSFYIAQYDPEEMQAIRWLQQAPYGTVAEAIGGSYTGYARVSTQTGLPTVLGWPGHESQWRGGAVEMGTREPDIAQLFRAKDWAQASEILQKYQIRYLYVGTLERSSYRPNEAFFESHMPVVFHNGEVTIYEFTSYDSQQSQAVIP